MVAFTGFSRPNTYIISTTGSNQLRQQVPSTITTTDSNKNSKMKATTIMVKTLAVANSPTKVPTTANVIKTTVSSPVHRFLSPKQSVTLSSTNNTNATSSLQQKNYSSSSTTVTTPSTLSSSSWTTLLGQNSNGYSDSDDSINDQNSSSASSNNSNCGEPKKRRRLTHLTPEEKILRR